MTDLRRWDMKDMKNMVADGERCCSLSCRSHTGAQVTGLGA